jgi:hypothetical protein
MIVPSPREKIALPKEQPALVLLPNYPLLTKSHLMALFGLVSMLVPSNVKRSVRLGQSLFRGSGS